MSFKGEIEAKCPNGCEPFETEIWSFIRGDKNEDLRLAVKARECNLLLCPACDKPFFPEAPYVYFDPAAELLAFVFPETYAEKEAFWRAKMQDDFRAMKESLGSQMPLNVEPELYFGPEGLGAVLDEDDFREEEAEVMRHYASELGLVEYRISPRYARERRLPPILPYKPAKKGQPPTRQNVIEGLETVVAANDRLRAYSDFLGAFKASGAEPPPAQ